ncbi:Het-C-domain-containing protein [Mycena indigotica]|uniref:Het-C-domain-containing protein n=1 Tax=Mycena indigotica TaxID=2126181 RepID=A0A8H6W6A1_9AGAR|nr:Het-C-domain-containing protein [Mycena indigotica]KAF7307409.1 Het-C-domain-containing protein [Mycena indigotica]
MHTLLLLFTLAIVVSLFFCCVWSRRYSRFRLLEWQAFRFWTIETSFSLDKAFRHGDIENILATLAKTAGHAALSGASGGDLLGFAKSLIKEAASGSGGAKFSSGDIKKGNWLRDYSQAMDIGGLSKLTADTLVLVVSVLGFMTFGFATQEFQVTAERLGVYLPVEHIDNPKGYAEKEGDARRFHPKLRPPVNPQELEIDERTGMKCYMATENRGWDTSTAHIRRVLVECIEKGRRAGGRDGPDLYEAYRLLGTGLHTLEDLLAHSNWVEIGLRKMGYRDVFCHVGDQTEIQTPNGRAPPLVTGTFGGADFLHSLMGEATDKLSQASVTDLASKMDQAQSQDQASKISTLKAILSKLPIGGGDSKVDEGAQLGEEAKAYNFDPNNVAPPEVQQKLLALLRWRDDVMRSILEKIEMIPGLEQLMDQLSEALNAYVYTVIAPWLTPILQQATSALGEGSKAVIDSDDQYEDHFGLILNEPAGKIAVLVVQHTVNVIVKAWSDNGDPNRAVDVILEAFHHPYYATGRSDIQNSMFKELERWIRDLDDDVARQTINALTKESVRNGKNKRLGSENQSYDEPGYAGCGHGHGASSRPGNQSSRPTQQQQYGGTQSSHQSSGYGQSGGGRRPDEDNSQSYGHSQSRPGNRGYEQETQSSYKSSSYGQSAGGNQSYGESQGRSHNRQDQSYGETQSSYKSSSGGQSKGGYREDEDNNQGRSGNQGYGQERSYGETQSSYQSSGYGRASNQDEGNKREQQYGGSRRQEEDSYGRQNEGYGRAEHHGQGDSYRRQEENYGGRNEHRKTEEHSYGRQQHETGYGRSEERSYGGRNEHQESQQRHGETGYGRSEERSYGGRNEYQESRHSSSGRNDYEQAQGGGRHQTSGYGREERQGYGNQETFGAERLNISDEGYGEEENRHHKKKSYY